MGAENGSGGGGGSGGAGGSGSGGGGSGSGGGMCVPGPEEPSPVQPSCADIAGLALGQATVKDADGDGLVKAGEAATISTSLIETAGKSFFGYPGVVFTSTTPGVEVGDAFWFYGIFACDAMSADGYVKIGGDVAPGTVVTVTARVGILHEDCPDAYAIQMPIEVH
ncbi:hypothetical protein [Polyangium sp. 15x6]|uniref:hypothetical protein n=1 Tax=Polyangium sp. 15x6 TaxID=3042687 RepID=UPI002499E5F7|nr:hypothetical protein [Polyangium sp. 15x6]MDI3285580.1 hypothetical protein [Polyangium sp. 15x6]